MNAKPSGAAAAEAREQWRQAPRVNPDYSLEYGQVAALQEPADFEPLVDGLERRAWLYRLNDTRNVDEKRNERPTGTVTFLLPTDQSTRRWEEQPEVMRQHWLGPLEGDVEPRHSVALASGARVVGGRERHIRMRIAVLRTLAA
jgi:hypothetical protein